MEMLAFLRIENRAADRRKRHRMSAPFEHGDEHALVDGIVFGYQDLEPGAVCGLRRVNGCRRLQHRVFERFRQPEASREMEATAFARRALYPDLTAHGLR